MKFLGRSVALFSFSFLLCLFCGLSVMASSINRPMIQNHVERRERGRTYKVSKKGTGWKVSYDIKTVGGKIVSTSNLKSSVLIGSLEKSSLKRVSDKKVCWKGQLKIGLIRSKVSCIALISRKGFKVK